MVKADAYGHGAVPVSRAVGGGGGDAGIRWLGVALVEEGVTLRRAGIRLPILVLGGAYEGGWETPPRRGRSPRSSSARTTSTPTPQALPAGATAAYHLKVDTGMGRIGVLPDGAPGRSSRRRGPTRASSSTASSPTSPTPTSPTTPRPRPRSQRFQDAVARVDAAGLKPTWLHLANSAAVLEGTVALETRALARPGLMLYGYPPAARFGEDAHLKPVLTWATRITHLKRVPQGFKVSYGQTWSAPRESLVATLPVGYADGYDRRHSNGAPVLVGGRRCEIIGRVCMDMCMVDVTDVPGVATGDEVVLLGRQGGQFVGADELADRIGTIPYEVLCAIGERVPRDP